MIGTPAQLLALLTDGSCNRFMHTHIGRKVKAGPRPQRISPAACRRFVP